MSPTSSLRHACYFRNVPQPRLSLRCTASPLAGTRGNFSKHSDKSPSQERLGGICMRVNVCYEGVYQG